MKKLILLLVLLITANIAHSKQDDRLDEFSFESSELKHETTPYFAIAGGATFTFQFANFDALNQHLVDNGFSVGEFSGQANLWGGEGFTGVVYVPNMRVGFFSYGGSQIKSFSNAGITREVEYKLGLSGLSIEYAIVPIKSFAIVPGVSLGRGDLSISTYEAPSESNWADYKPLPGANNHMNVISTDYWSVKPNLHLEYALTNFLMFRGSVSYNLTFGNSWKQNNLSTLNNVPDELNANAFQIQAGIFVGLFNY